MRLTSPLSLNEMYNVMGAMRGCHTVKFDFCSNL